MNNYNEKCRWLLAAIDEYTRKDCLIAFSGGVDSSLILKMACDAALTHGTMVYAVTVHTSLHPMGELDIAAQLANEMGAVHKVISIDELSHAGVNNNPPDRCYRCKKYLFSQLLELAAELGVDTVLEGTNEDDLHQYRPGIRALKELNINSPLAAAMFTKADVRQMAAEYGISVANRPSAPCLATRFPYGTALSMELMAKVDEAERFLRSEGFYNVRIRVHGDIARVEVNADELPALIERREAVIQCLKEQGFDYITIDLEGFRSGSMDLRVADQSVG